MLINLRSDSISAADGRRSLNKQDRRAQRPLLSFFEKIVHKSQ